MLKGKAATFMENDKAVDEKQDNKTVAEAEPANADAVPEKHDDAAQDMELIKQMLDEYLGKESYGEADVKACQEAMAAAMEMGGHSKEESMKMAAGAMKMANYMQKADAKKKESCPAEEKKDEKVEEPTAAEKPETAKKESADTAEDVEESKAVVESNKKLKVLEDKIAEQAGVIANLKESTKKVDIEKHLDEVCQKSGLSREATKTFRESLGAPKSKEQIDTAWKLFEGGYKSSRGGEAIDLSDVFIQPEKAAPVKSDDLGLSDCLN
jgi:hypothetical protein